MLQETATKPSDAGNNAFDATAEDQNTAESADGTFKSADESLPTSGASSDDSRSSESDSQDSKLQSVDLAPQEHAPVCLDVANKAAMPEHQAAAAEGTLPGENQEDKAGKADEAEAAVKEDPTRLTHIATAIYDLHLGGGSLGREEILSDLQQMGLGLQSDSPKSAPEDKVEEEKLSEQPSPARREDASMSPGTPDTAQAAQDISLEYSLLNAGDVHLHSDHAAHSKVFSSIST